MSIPKSVSTILGSMHGRPCVGDFPCHWCNTPCGRMWQHDDKPILPFVPRSTARNPTSPYICNGCWVYKQPRRTVHFLSGGFRDKQCLQNHSWLLTESEIKVIEASDATKLYDFLLSPEKIFSLSLITEGENLLHFCTLNQTEEIRADTEFKFTINNVVFNYTIYELEEALKLDSLDGWSGGVRELIRIYGPYAEMQENYKKQLESQQVKKKENGETRGRPPRKEDAGDRVKKVIREK